jgi:hypothetical protein
MDITTKSAQWSMPNNIGRWYHLGALNLENIHNKIHVQIRNNRRIDCRLAKKICKCKEPMKIRIFLWQAFENRLEAAQQLKSRKWKGSEYIVLYVWVVNMLGICCSLAP